jgi:1-phosphofructokinase
MIYTVTLNPALDKTAQIPDLKVDEVNRIVELRRDAGGKGINVSKVIKELGGATEAWAILAGNTGAWVQSALEADGIRVNAILAEGETRTNLKVVDPVNDTHTDINEPGPEVTDSMLNDMLIELANAAPADGIVVVSGSLPTGVRPDTYERWCRVLRMGGIRVFLDADGEALAHGIEGRPYFIKPNDHELSALVGRELKSVAEVAQASRELVGRGIPMVVVSMGGEGAVFCTEAETWYASSVKVPVGSTVGAGDSVVAATAYAVNKGMPLEDTMRLAMATGAANVMQSGTQAAERSIVDSLVDKVALTRLP